MRHATVARGNDAKQRSGRETIAEHWETADRFRLGRLILKNVPVLGELAVFEAYYIGGDP